MGPSVLYPWTVAIGISSTSPPVTTTLSTSAMPQDKLKKVRSIQMLLLMFLYYVWYGRVKPFVVVVVVSERISELISLPGIHQWHPPNKNIPTGDRQATWWLRPVDRVWDCSHFPSNVRQLSPPLIPPHTENPSWVWWWRPGGGRLGMWQLRPPGTHTSTVLWPSPSLLRPPVNNIAEKNLLNN